MIPPCVVVYVTVDAIRSRDGPQAQFYSPVGLDLKLVKRALRAMTTVPGVPKI